MNSKHFERFRERLGEVMDVRAAIALLHWDQEVYMPPKGAPARGKQLATLAALEHRLFTAPAMGRLLDKLTAVSDPDAALLLAETRYDYERAKRLPETFVQRFAEECSKAYHAWVTARETSRFDMFKPHLETLVGMLRQKADYLGYEGSPYNALLEDYERGMSAEQLQRIFGELAPKQSALVERIVHAPHQPDLSWLEQEWNEQTQWDISIQVLKDMGYDFEAGRQDKSVHPFTTNFDLHDVRITTRFNPRDPFSSLMGSIHEGGHALYEQGFQEKDQRTTLAQAPSLGIHESQSRFWENVIGRSRPFWNHYVPLLKRRYPGQLDAATPEQVYQAVNRVRPSLVRVEADECTYNLHIILRFEIEVALIEGRLNVAEMPDVWNAKMKQYLGVDVPNDAQGCLQDIHWSHGAMGYFPTYALGNLYAAQLLECMLRDAPRLWDQVVQGDFIPILEWLRTHVHQIGRRKTAVQILRDITGAEPNSEPFLRYLETKYLPLYGLGTH